MSETSMLQWALYYQKQGLSIIPVKGKHPLVKWKEFQGRKANEQEIEKWWTEWPEADIGMVTGEITKSFVVDIDGEEGQRSISRISLPPTRKVQTKRGFQLHFIYPTGTPYKTTLAGLLPGVDIRGEGGYVKLPPSQFSDSSGRYSWVGSATMDIQDCPESILELLKEYNKPTTPQVTHSDIKESWLEEVLGGVADGGRHQALCKLFGYYANTMNLDAAATHIREWNRRNIPPYTDVELEEQITNWVNGFKNGSYSAGFVEPKHTELVSIKTDTDKYLKEIQDRTKWTEPEFKTGFSQLDRLTRGFQKQNLFVIGAPTNGGKTQFVLSNIHALLKSGKRVLYFSTEMPQNEIKDRFNAIGAGIPLDEIRTGFLTSFNKQKLIEYLPRVNWNNFVISPEDTPSIETIRMAVQDANPDIIFLDHIHHIKLKSDNRRTEIDDFISGLKRVVLERNIPCVITAQLRRKEGFNGKPPVYTMHDFKESGGIENEAGVCLLLCPPDEWTEERMQKVTAYIPKNRHGRREVRFQLNFDTQNAEFKEITI